LEETLAEEVKEEEGHKIEQQLPVERTKKENTETTAVK